MLTTLSSLIPFCVSAVIGLEELAEEMAHVEVHPPQGDECVWEDIFIY